MKNRQLLLIIAALLLLLLESCRTLEERCAERFPTQVEEKIVERTYVDTLILPWHSVEYLDTTVCPPSRDTVLKIKTVTRKLPGDTVYYEYMCIDTQIVYRDQAKLNYLQQVVNVQRAKMETKSNRMNRLGWVIGACGKVGTAKVTDARRAVAMIGKQQGYSLNKIGRAINKHHSSVHHYQVTGQSFVNQDDPFKGKLHDTVRELNINIATIMKSFSFEPGPPLWPEQYTDYFTFDVNTEEHKIANCIKEAVAEAAEPTYETRGVRHLFTDNQVLVDELKDAAYGYEIPFQHVHVPEHYG